jgi:hypothetical protein
LGRQVPLATPDRPEQPAVRAQLVQQELREAPGQPEEQGQQGLPGLQVQTISQTATPTNGTGILHGNGLVIDFITTSAGIRSALSDETGTALLYFQDGALGTPSSGTLTNCTFPTLNQNTTGSAAKWTTARNLANNSVDGSANVAFANKFIVQGTADAGLSAAQFLGALGTGLVKNTTTTGVLSIGAAGTDYIGTGSIIGNGQTMNTARLLGRTTASSGAIEEITVSTGLSLAGGVLTNTVTAGANTALSNLASVAINTTLLPGLDDAIDLGSDALRFHALKFKLASGFVGWGTGGADGSIDDIGTSGATTMRFMNAASGYTFDGNVSLSAGTLSVPDNAYGSGWNGSTAVPTRNAVYDKIETITTRITTVKTTIYITGSAATHNFTSGMLYCEVWCTGQGGGGGGSRASDATSQANGSGGGAGGTAYILYNATEAGATATYTVGTAAGAGGSNVGGNGTAGTSSTFDPAGTGATITGTGGALGTGLDNATPAVSFRLGGLGGVPTNGSLNITGGDGGTAAISSTVGTTIPIVSGDGGSSFWGGGPQAVVVVTGTTTAGVAGKAYGTGGSGSVSLNSSAGSVGGNGAVGVIKIVEYIQ